MTKHNETQDREPFPVAITRRKAIGATAVGATAAAAMAATPAGATDAVTALLARVTEKNAAIMRGDMRRWAELAPIAPDFSIMQPFGGLPTQGFNASPERLAELSQYFRNGTCETELMQAYVSPELIVLSIIERQTCEVGGLPLQNWSLRVTEVWRRVGSDWQFAHRHADPLVDSRNLAQTAALAKGLKLAE